MLIPRRVKHRKQHHPDRTGAAKGGTNVTWGEWGLQALEPAYVTNRQIESARSQRAVDIPVCVEMAAPDTDDWIDRLKDAGLGSILLNLELWDPEVRRRVMPGKAAITRERYLEALGHAARVLGAHQSSSQVIIGLEPVENTLQAVRAIADVGAIPLPVVFRPLAGTQLEDVPTPPLGEVLQVFDEVLRVMGERGLAGESTRSGCALCGACSAHR